MNINAREVGRIAVIRTLLWNAVLQAFSANNGMKINSKLDICLLSEGTENSDNSETFLYSRSKFK
jgi:hypothetical protein